MSVLFRLDMKKFSPFILRAFISGGYADVAAVDHGIFGEAVETSE